MTTEAKKILNRRYSASFFNLLKDYNSRSFLSKDELLLFKKNKLIEFLNVASNIKYYSKFGFKSGKEDIENIISTLPIISKEEVKQHKLEIVDSSSKHQPLLKVHTSGTTGSGLNFYQTRQGHQDNLLFGGAIETGME